MLAGILTCAGGDFRCEQIHDEAVFVGSPDGTVAPQETGSGTFFASKTVRTVQQALHKPLESHRYFRKPAAQPLDHLVDHAAAHQGLADGSLSLPQGTVHEQVTDGHREVM